MALTEVQASGLDDETLCELGREVIAIESAAAAALIERIDESFARACRLLLDCRGRIIVCGIGKSGHIGQKLAATFASTGSPAFFVHAAEASHGDLGMLREHDVVLAISYSGDSRELLTLLPGFKQLGVSLIALCGEADSALARASDVWLDTRVEREACPLNLAPTASTTVSLVLGDALAIALLGARGFGPEDFARSHPGGRLGRRLLVRVADIMAHGERLPLITPLATLADALMEMSSKGLGMVVIVDDERHLCGLFTDGDLRRSLDQDQDPRGMPITDLMTTEPHRVDADTLAFEALDLMQSHRITSLPVVVDDQLVGVLTLHALLGAGVA